MTSIADDTGSLPDLDLDFAATPEASALQAVADSMAHDHDETQHSLERDEVPSTETSTAQQPPQLKPQQPPARVRSPSTSGNEKDSDSEPPSKGQKRASPTPPEDLNAPAAKVTKRRAARACVSCRARKVRCDVVEGAPCGNCRWDNVECVVQESRRRKKTLVTASTAGVGAEAQLRAKGTGTGIPPLGSAPINIQSSADLRHPSNASSISAASIAPAAPALDAGISVNVNGSVNGNSNNNGGPSANMAGGMGGMSGMHGISGASSGSPHMIYQQQQQQQQTPFRQDTNILSKLQAAASADSNTRRLLANLLTQAQAASSAPPTSFGDLRTSRFLASLEDPDLHAQLPAFVKPLPARIATEDVKYLHIKGAISLPPLQLQTALLQAYVEYVHPYMPLLDLHEFLSIVNSREGLCGQVSLFLYQAVMFAATAFVDMKSLREAGYATRKAARRSFFQKTRLLYDFDYESDRLVLVQSLLLMTYWYETPDDQKDTWHWMGVAISLAHTIGLHRNPATTSMPVRKQKLWKRIWWSCFMRDRLVALGMRRPTRIKDEDYDVPMLVESDFEIEVLAEGNTAVPPECTLMRDLAMQRDLAVMCVAKAELCVCISNMLKAQYSVLIRDKAKPDNTINSTMMLFPNKKLDNFESVTTVDLELMAWAEALPPVCQYRPLTPLDVKNGRSTVAVQRHLLHMVYYTTISALHRPQFLPSSPTQAPTASRQVQEMSRLRVRDAAMHITRMASELHQLRLEKYLPTTGVTVILPAMIIHLLEMKNPIAQSRDRATRGFKQCMRVMEKLREIYAAADYATGFLEAALSKASIDLQAGNPAHPITQQNLKLADPTFTAQTPPPDNAPYMTSAEALFNQKAGTQQQQQPQQQQPHQLQLQQQQQHVQLAAAMPQTINAAALDLSLAGTASPPPTDRDLESAVGGVTPSASGGGSDGDGAEPLDMDFLQAQGDIDWNAMAGTEFDMDQWLQFPPEGVNNQDEGLMANVFGEEGKQDAMNWVAAGFEPSGMT